MRVRLVKRCLGAHAAEARHTSSSEPGATSCPSPCGKVAQHPMGGLEAFGVLLDVVLVVVIFISVGVVMVVVGALLTDLEFEVHGPALGQQ